MYMTCTCIVIGPPVLLLSCLTVHVRHALIVLNVGSSMVYNVYYSVHVQPASRVLPNCVCIYLHTVLSCGKQNWNVNHSTIISAIMYTTQPDNESYVKGIQGHARVHMYSWHMYIVLVCVTYI